MLKVIGICGGSGCGKTTISKKLAESLGEESSLISMDSYYLDRSGMTEDEMSDVNFDHPDSMDMDLLFSDLDAYKNGSDINVPNYCFETHSRTGIAEVVKSGGILIIEGILALHDKRLRSLYDMKIFMDADSDIRLIRRIRRDTRERGRDVNSILFQYEKTVQPMFNQYVLPQRQHSDLVINCDGSISLETHVDEIIGAIHKS